MGIIATESIGSERKFKQTLSVYHNPVYVYSSYVPKFSFVFFVPKVHLPFLPLVSHGNCLHSVCLGVLSC